MRKQFLLMTLLSLTTFNIFGQNAKEKDFKKISSKIFPVIKVEGGGNTTSYIEFTDETQPVFKKIAGDLLCFYGIDRGTHFELILKKQLPESVDLEKLHGIAEENLQKEYRKQIELHETNFGGYALSCGGEHEAALITIGGVLDIMVEELGENLVFAVPAKDLIFFVNGNNPEEIKSLKNIIEEVHQDGERLLSKKLYTYRNGKIEEK